ncbi:MAG: hypothetical protein JOY60_06365 [Burkholderiaceae bacterium]|nr:hypothetical protein [Roseateles sp.]MBV8469472.1 hypothetical protein [Burkholderiaceae bacterium]
MKTYDIEIQRLKAIKHDHGLIRLSVDASLQPRPSRDGQDESTCLYLSVDDARTLQALLKQQITELDKLLPRSRRSGRC